MAAVRAAAFSKRNMMKFVTVSTGSRPSARRPSVICFWPAMRSLRVDEMYSWSPMAATAAACAIALTLNGCRTLLRRSMPSGWAIA